MISKVGINYNDSTSFDRKMSNFFFDILDYLSLLELLLEMKGQSQINDKNTHVLESGGSKHAYFYILITAH